MIAVNCVARARLAVYKQRAGSSPRAPARVCEQAHVAVRGAGARLGLQSSAYPTRLPSAAGLKLLTCFTNTLRLFDAVNAVGVALCCHFAEPHART